MQTCKSENDSTSVMYMRKEIFKVPEEMLINYFLGLWLVLRKVQCQNSH